MSRKLRSRRPSKKQTLYAVQGIAIGLIASLVFISGCAIIVRFNDGTHIGYVLPFGLVLFTTIFVVMVYRLWRVEVEPEENPQNQRSLLHDPVIETTANAEDVSEAIRLHKESVKPLLDKESVKSPLDSLRIYTTEMILAYVRSREKVKPTRTN